MQDYLRKPIDRDRLYAALLRWRGRRVGASTAAEPRRVPAVFEPERALGRLGGRLEVLEHLLRGFRRDYGVDHPLFELAPGSDLQREVHTLKGLADSLGLPRLQQAAAAWEQALREGQSDAALRERTRLGLEEALRVLERERRQGEQVGNPPGGHLA